MPTLLPGSGLPITLGMKLLLTWLLAACGALVTHVQGVYADDRVGDTESLREVNFTNLVMPDIELLRPGRGGEYFEFIPVHPVHFAHDQDVLDDRARRVLDDTALLIRHLPGVTRVIIKGFTDFVASEAYNDTLSDRRAAAVYNYLIEHGVAAQLLHMTGYGKSIPVDEEWTREGRARNRRVEIYLVRQQR